MKAPSLPKPRSLCSTPIRRKRSPRASLSRSTSFIPRRSRESLRGWSRCRQIARQAARNWADSQGSNPPAQLKGGKHHAGRPRRDGASSRVLRDDLCGTRALDRGIGQNRAAVVADQKRHRHRVRAHGQARARRRIILVLNRKTFSGCAIIRPMKSGLGFTKGEPCPWRIARVRILIYARACPCA
jgi:hypothetical protein